MRTQARAEGIPEEAGFCFAYPLRLPQSSISPVPGLQNGAERESSRPQTVPRPKIERSQANEGKCCGHYDHYLVGTENVRGIQLVGNIMA
jgi:hypothetical protein